MWKQRKCPKLWNIGRTPIRRLVCPLFADTPGTMTGLALVGVDDAAFQPASFHSLCQRRVRHCRIVLSFAFDIPESRSDFPYWSKCDDCVYEMKLISVGRGSVEIASTSQPNSCLSQPLQHPNRTLHLLFSSPPGTAKGRRTLFSRLSSGRRGWTSMTMACS